MIPLSTLGSCNPECSGSCEKKIIKRTRNLYKTNLGGIVGADAICVTEFGSGWKAVLVGGTRRATRTPFAADGQQDWVIKKYVHFYNELEDIPAANQGTCQGWTSDGAGGTGNDGNASFCDSDLRPSASESCGATSFILCVQQ